MARFDGKTILVTGASSGIGRACAQRLEHEGAQLWLVGRNEAALREVADGRPHRIHLADLTDEVAVKQLVTQIHADAGQLHDCVLAAGIRAFRPLRLESFAGLAQSWEANIQSSLGLLALALRARLLVREASVVLFSSAAVSTAAPGAMAYAASKAALEAAVRTLAVELATQRVRVNAVAPGVVRTPMTEGWFSKLAPAQTAQLEARHPLGFGCPEDIAGPVAFLLSSESRWVTGAVLVVDGGFSIA